MPGSWPSRASTILPELVTTAAEHTQQTPVAYVTARLIAGYRPDLLMGSSHLHCKGRHLVANAVVEYQLSVTANTQSRHVWLVPPR